jgi:hypothetical protein
MWQSIQIWFRRGGEMTRTQATHSTHPWYVVIWLTGVDYFSSLAYQAGIALLAAGTLAPVATAVLSMVTLFGAVPVYMLVARRSYSGQGSIALLENLLGGWWGKLLILVLLGFAATDFVITMTLSAADAARHATENAYLHPYLGSHSYLITIVLLALLAAVFIAGFREAIALAVMVAIPYLLLNAILLVKCAAVVWADTALIGNWKTGLFQTGDITHVLVQSVIIFPSLALGLSGFETGVSVMPLIRGNPNEGKPPVTRIINTTKLLISAAVIMCIFLMLSSITTTMLIAPDDYKDGGPANGRALAFLAYRYFGNAFGSIYDISTIAILWFAGASAMAGLLNLIPRYLPRLGMAPRWTAFARPLVCVLFVIDLIVTFVFDADVDKQSGAYATGVLVIILSAAIAAAVALMREGRETRSFTSSLGTGVNWLSFICWMIAIVFAYALVQNVRERPDGLIIGSIFIVTLITTSILSRYFRQGELRVRRLNFCDAGSAQVWEEMLMRRVNIVPVEVPSQRLCEIEKEKLMANYRIEGPIAFLNVGLMDNRSEFYEEPVIKVMRLGEDYRIDVSEATVVANTIAYLCLVLKARAVFIRLTQHSPLTQAFRYFLLGTGEIALMVHEILVHRLRGKPEFARTRLYLMST